MFFPSFALRAKRESVTHASGNIAWQGVEREQSQGNSKSCRLSQIQLAQRAKVSRFRLSLAETGSLELRDDEVIAIRNAVTPEIRRTARLTSEFELSRTAAAV
jgi:hypothetical protein